MPNPKHQQFDWNGIELLVDEITVTGTVNGALSSVAVVTDNSGGTSGGNTIAAVTDVATAANAIATLAAKLNAVINAMN